MLDFLFKFLTKIFKGAINVFKSQGNITLILLLIPISGLILTGQILDSKLIWFIFAFSISIISYENDLNISIEKTKINLILYIDSLMIGGMHRQTLYLAKYLDKNKFDIIVLTQNTNEGGLRNEFYNSGCKMIDLGRNSIPSKKKKSFNPFISYKLYKKIFKREKTDVIYLNAAPNLIYFKIANFFLNKKISLVGSFKTLTFWKGHLNKSYKWLDILFAQLLYSSSKYTIVNTSALNKHYSKFLK